MPWLLMQFNAWMAWIVTVCSASSRLRQAELIPFEGCPPAFR
jgi:hypothetical protein